MSMLLDVIGAGLTRDRRGPLPSRDRERPSVARLIDSLIARAGEAGASDLHIDPTDTAISVRMRVDGELRTCEPLIKDVHDELIARLKVLANLRTDEHVAPQDGRFRHDDVNGERLDIRLSIAPTFHGENAVLRFLRATGGAPALSDLGFSEEHEALLREAVSRTHGMILITGPTGSGKTTTLYALMRLLMERPLSLVTIEDPIEYSLPGVVQMPIRAGYGFVEGLRSMLRQDPDIIMVGEIRDAETAGLAVNAALTGHLVLSTLHTNDAASAIPRLMDLKVEPYLIASTVTLVVAQRLVRNVCGNCVIEKRLSRSERNRLSAAFGESVPEWISRGRGCERCENSGYRGRTGVYEACRVGSAMREAIAARSSAQALRERAIADGMIPLLTDGLGKIAAGSTTPEEVLRLRYA